MNQQPQPFAIEFFDGKDYLRGHLLRESHSIQKLSADEVSQGLARLDGIEKDYLSRIKTYPQLFIKMLEGFREYDSKNGNIPPKTKVCARAILHLVAKPTLESSFSALKEGRVREFIRDFDCISGLLHIAAAVRTAADTLEESNKHLKDTRFDGAYINFLKAYKGLPEDATSGDIEHAKQESIHAARLFEKDPSGFLLIQQIVDTIEKESRGEAVPYQYIESYQHPDLIVAGALFGQKIYETLYKLWEQNS